MTKGGLSTRKKRPLAGTGWDWRSGGAGPQSQGGGVGVRIRAGAPSRGSALPNAGSRHPDVAGGRGSTLPSYYHSFQGTSRTLFAVRHSFKPLRALFSGLAFGESWGCEVL